MPRTLKNFSVGGWWVDPQWVQCSALIQSFGFGLDTWTNWTTNTQCGLIMFWQFTYIFFKLILKKKYALHLYNHYRFFRISFYLSLENSLVSSLPLLNTTMIIGISNFSSAVLFFSTFILNHHDVPGKNEASL